MDAASIQSRLEAYQYAAGLDLLGRGHFANVYADGDRVFKWAGFTARPDTLSPVSNYAGLTDGTHEWIKWVHKRMQRYGPDHQKMQGMPRVFSVGEGGGTWWAQMERYTPLSDHPGLSVWEKRKQVVDVMVSKFWPLLSQFNSGGALDLHGDNVMWAQERREFIVTDPFSYGTSQTPEVDIDEPS